MTKETQPLSDDRLTTDPAFAQEILNCHNISRSFLIAVTSMTLMANMFGVVRREFLMFRLAEQCLESAASVLATAVEGMQNPARRELRYLLEMAVKFLYVDQQVPDLPLDEKLLYLTTSVSHSSVDEADALRLPGLPAAYERRLKSEIHDLFAKLSRYVHPSVSQIEDHLRRYQRGERLGVESAKEIARFNRIMFRVYDIVLVLYFHGIGLGPTGDLFVGVLDDLKTWRFHKGKYVKVLSAAFNYKVERQARTVREQSAKE